jgi:hypothetical protein
VLLDVVDAADEVAVPLGEIMRRQMLDQ